MLLHPYPNHTWMKPLTNESVKSYYRYVNDLLGKTSLSNIKEEDIDLLCVRLKKQIDLLFESIKCLLKRNLPDSATLFNKFVLDLGLELAPKEASKYLDKRTEADCGLSYDEDNNEYRIWIIALMTTSWIITNWEKKTEDGHCQNKGHWSDEQHQFCPVGSKFHKELYDECIKTFENISVLM